MNLKFEVVESTSDLVPGLHGDTRVSTDRGLRPIREVAEDGGAVLRGPYGRWEYAQVRMLGVRPLMRVELSRMRAQKVLLCAADHPWITLGNGTGNTAKKETVTSELRPDEYLAASFGRGASGSVSALGVMRGVVYGDGHRDGRGSSVDLYGVKRMDLGPYFANMRMSGPHAVTRRGFTNEFTSIHGLPAHLKEECPDLSDDRSYLRGWLAGYLATDGSVNTSGGVSLSSADVQDLEYVTDLCDVLGIGTQPITRSETSAGIVRAGTMYSLRLLRATVPAELLIRPHHRERFDGHEVALSPGRQRRSRNWRVRAVTACDSSGEVFGTAGGRFAVEGQILT